MQPIATFRDQIGPNSIGVKHLGLEKNDLSGDLIDGGMITNFSSTGISDNASKNMMTLTDDKIVIKSGLNIVDGNNKSILEIDNNSIRFKRNILAESIIETKVSLSPVIEVVFDNDKQGSGLVAKDQFNVQYLLYKDNNWQLSDSIKLPNKKTITIGNRLALSESELGSTITKSNLKKVGVLDELRVRGDFNINETLYYNATSNRLGINVLDPNGVLGLMENGVEIVVKGEDYLRAKIGTVTKHELQFVTNNQTALVIDIDGKVTIGNDDNFNSKLKVSHNIDSDYSAGFSNSGKGVIISAGLENKLVVQDNKTKKVNLIVNDSKVGINVVNPEAALHVNGDVKMMNKHMWSAPNPPSSGTNYQGDIVWNSNPGPTQPIGWVCIKDGVPGVWAVFGRIESV